MPRPYSVDLRERVLVACEADGDSCAAVARRFRVAISTLHLWRRQARGGWRHAANRRAPRRMGRGPAPLAGGLDALAALAAERNDATLAEHAGMFAVRTGHRPSLPVVCRALKRLGWVRKQRRSGRASRIGRTWSPPGRRGGPRRRGSIRRG
jgi:transposase